MGIEEKYFSYLDEHNSVFLKLNEISADIIKAARLIVKTLRKGNKILICGNGGSAADAQHLAAELVGRFEKERIALPAIALTTDSSIYTAVGNDYGFDAIFSRQVEALSLPGDVIIGISTSGNSNNVLLAIDKARRREVKSIGLLGSDGGKLASEVNISVIVPNEVTARIQEVHIFILHFWTAIVEEELFSSY